MAFLDAQQGRALAIMLSTTSLIAHIGAFVVLETAFSKTWTDSWCVFYDLCAIFASLGGVIGAVDRRPVAFSVYAIVHTTTLVMISGVLFLNALPAPIATALPVWLRQLRYTEDLERSMCHEDGFGWDEHWPDQCRSGFATLSTGAIWIGSAMLAAQWWAISEVWRWVATKCNKLERREDIVILGKASFVDEKQGLRVIKEV